MRTTFPIDLLLSLRARGGAPLHDQLKRQLRAAVQTGRLPAGTRLPSTRSLAADMGLSRGVVVEAYEQLIAEGYFTSSPGSGTRVGAVRTPEAAPETEAPAPRPIRYDFRPGLPDLRAFPMRDWLASVQRAAKEATAIELAYPDPQGPLRTRSAVASYLARSRAVVGRAADVVMCGGVMQALNLVAGVMRERGIRRVAVEDPAFGHLHRVFHAAGIRTQAIRVDGRGLVVEDLVASSAQAVVVTPAHHFPTGASLSAERRVALAEWAVSGGRFVVEDDYDAEFRYDRSPLGALQGLAPDHVLYVGSASKTLSPALRLGWILAPAGWTADLAQAKRQADGGAPTLDQLAMACFLEQGLFERHLRSMRSVYQARRDVMVAALERHFPQLTVCGIAAGLHMMLKLPAGADEAALCREASAAGIELFAASRFSALPVPARRGLVLGYGGIEKGRIAPGIRQLADVVRAVSPPV